MEWLDKDPVLALHEGEQGKSYFHSMIPPVCMTSLHTFDSLEEMSRFDSSGKDAFIYGRVSNPTVEILEEKVKLALANNLKPIFCIGEVLEEREANKQNEVVAAQLASVFSLSAEDFSKIILAYEPVWAIGTGKTATAEQAQEIHAFIRSLIADKYGKEVADNTSILYGGSCKPSNAKELFANPDVDGGLIGGAALKVVDFKGIIDAFK